MFLTLQVVNILDAILVLMIKKKRLSNCPVILESYERRRRIYHLITTIYKNKKTAFWSLISNNQQITNDSCFFDFDVFWNDVLHLVFIDLFQITDAARELQLNIFLFVTLKPDVLNFIKCYVDGLSERMYIYFKFLQPIEHAAMH